MSPAAVSAPSRGAEPRADGLAIFGATGDLARRFLWPAVYELAARGALADVTIVGVARSEWDDDGLRRYARESLDDVDGLEVDEGVWSALAAQLRYVQGEYTDVALYEGLAERLEGVDVPIVYLAIPPFLFDDVVQGLTKVGLNERARLLVEKPFGRDLETAQQLNRCVLGSFPEERVYRIDHYLAKEPVENLLVFRFANAMFEPIWNRSYVASIQITLAEDIGVLGRGSFYEGVGAIRDVVQNHLLQILTFVAMEAPVAADADALRDEKNKVLRAIRTLTADDVVVGQYAGYREEPGVDPESQVETYVAMRLAIDSWRWAGVPFIVRAGKCLAAKATEVVVEFQLPPRMLFAPSGHRPHPNHLVFRLGGDDGVTLGVQAKAPGGELATRPVDLDLSFEEVFGERDEPYERLLADAFVGDRRRFARNDAVEEAWRILDPVLRDRHPVERYEPGSWGPAAADAIAEPSGGWHVPGTPLRGHA